MLMAVTAAFYAAGYTLRSEANLPGVGRGLLLTASSDLGRPAFLIAQTFLAGAKGRVMPAGLVRGVLPIAYFFARPDTLFFQVLL